MSQASRSRPMTLQPALRSASAAARPMPRAAPVTSAVLANQPRHGEADALQVAHQLLFLVRGQLDERRPAGLPRGVVAEMRDDRLERRNHRLLLHDLARGADARLQLVRLRRAPALVEVGDRARIDVAGGGDAAL